jgi:hypothetical protein
MGTVVTAQTDASETGWGVVLPWGKETGFFSVEESLMLSNWQELFATTGTVRSIARRWPNSAVVIKTDNTTSRAIIQNQGSTTSITLLALSKRMFQDATCANLRLNSRYLPGAENVRADYLSRLPYHSDYYIRED